MAFGFGDALKFAAIGPLGTALSGGNFLGRPFGPDPKAEIQDPRLQSGNFLRGQIRGALGQVDSRTAPQAGGAQIALSPQDQFRQQQLGLAQQLSGISSGQQQGAGELAVQRQGNQALANQFALARGARGPGAGLAARNAASNVSNIGVNVAGQAGIAALQDQTQARGQLAGLLGQGRGQDIGLAGQQAQLDQGIQLANLDAQLRARGLDDATRLALLQQMTGINATELQARIQQAQLAAAQRDPGVGADLLQAGGTALTAAAVSDERAKTDIEDAEVALKGLLDKLAPKSFAYKDPERDGKGRRFGVMAQALEKSPLGAAMVETDADGRKIVNYGKGYSTIMAALAAVNRRVNRLEGESA